MELSVAEGTFSLSNQDRPRRAVLLPGAIDAHVHLNEPGRANWEGFATGTRAAAAGGIVLLGDMPLNSAPVTTLAAALREKVQASSGKLTVDVAPYGGLVAGSAGEIAALLDAGVLAVKAFLCDSGLPEFPAASEADLRAAMPLLAEGNVPLLVHAELVSQARAGEEIRSLAAWAASRPPRYELDAIALMIRLCRETWCPVHIVHLAAAEALPMLRLAKGEGLPITVETCPHYLLFDLENSPAANTLWKCAPPIRGRANREALWEAVLDGTIDLIGSDHSPCPPSMKHLLSVDFDAAWGGISGLQFLVPALWTAGRTRGLTLERLSKLITDAPRRLLRLASDSAALLPGRPLTGLLFDPDQNWELSEEFIYHRHHTTPYLGLQFKGRVRATWLRGECVYHVEHGFTPELRGSMILKGKEPE